MGLNPSEDFPVALSSAKLFQKRVGIETEKSDEVLVSGRIEGPGSMETKTTVDKGVGGNGRQLPALQGVNNNRAAGLERLGQFPDGSSAHRIDDKTKPLPVESPLDVLLQVVALVDYTVASKLADLFSGFFPADDVKRIDSCELRELND